MERLDVDYVALSGHKLYAPFGAGALIGRRDWLDAGEPMLAGGGAVRFVTIDDVSWADSPGRHEAGSPNVVGAMALGVACQTLSDYGMDRIAAEEAALHAALSSALEKIGGIHRYRVWDRANPCIGVVTFNMEDQPHGLVAAALAAEQGISVRSGCFCAHPLMLRLLGLPEDEAERVRQEMISGCVTVMPGAVRLSTGLATTFQDVARVADALAKLAAGGPSWSYRRDPMTGEYVPDPDDRALPSFGGRVMTSGAR